MVSMQIALKGIAASADETDASCARTGPPFGDVAEAGNGKEPIP